MPVFQPWTQAPWSHYCRDRRCQACGQHAIAVGPERTKCACARGAHSAGTLDCNSEGGNAGPCVDCLPCNTTAGYTGDHCNTCLRGFYAVVDANSPESEVGVQG